MNKTATSRQALLEAAREIARRDGLGHISIRRAAAMCGVSVGTVYNYYPAKADLVLAVIEDFWKRVFHGGLSCDFTHGSDFSAVCGQIYTALRTHLAQFEHTFLRELASLNEAERQQGKALEIGSTFERACWLYLPGMPVCGPAHLRRLSPVSNSYPSYSAR